jgi:very-short-patch-repair endonuclease
VTRPQLLRLGLGPAAIAYRVRTGRLFRAHLGVYAVGRPPAAPLERAAAAVLACGPGAALSHESALTLWGLARRWSTPFHVTVAHHRRRSGIVTHECPSLARTDVRTQLGIRVTSPARTLLDCAPDLAPRGLARAVNDARVRGLVSPDDLAEVVRRFSRHPGRARVASLIGAGNGPTRSEFEDRFLAFCERFGLPRPQVNARVCGYEVDALFAAERVIVELDGWDFHQDRGAFERDRNRDADMLAAGLVTVRITWARMTGSPRKEAARLSSILAQRRAASCCASVRSERG